MYFIWFYSKKKLYHLYTIEYFKKWFGYLKNHWTKIIFFYKEDKSFSLDIDIIKKINNTWITIIPFKKRSEITDYIAKLSWKIFIYISQEQEINFWNTIKKYANQKTTKNIKIFTNKYLQRSIIWKIYPETIVQYKYITQKEAKNISEKKLPPMPCIVKPTWWIQSSGVCKIKNHMEYIKSLKIIEQSFEKLKNKKLLNKKIIIEEYIDWKMYTIDYYVDENQNIIVAKPVFIKLWIDYWINDFCNILRITSKDVENEIDNTSMNELIKKTVYWWNIRNTFVHHEFKINSKWEYKTIEINWRIWWYRLSMYQVWYHLNLLSFPFQKRNKSYSIKKNTATFVLYPKKNWSFMGFNDEIIDKIKKLRSFYKIQQSKNNIWEKIGLTKSGYSNLWFIILANWDYKQFKKDISYIEKKYFEIIYVV